MSEGYSVAILGATGLVGEALLTILEQREFPVRELFPLASERSAGRKVRFRDREYTVEDVAGFDFSRAQIGLFSAGASVSEIYAPKAGDAGCVVIDNTSRFRLEDDIPLVVPEVNPDAVGGFRSRNIIANPNCSTIQMVVALGPLHRAVGVERVNVATYQAVSGAGRGLVEDLARQTSLLLSGKPLGDMTTPKQIAFNLLPQIDVWEKNRYSREEMKMVWETRKILDEPGMLINPTAVRVPVFFGHSEAIHAETRDKISAQGAADILRAAPGITVLDHSDSGGYPTPVTEAAGNDPVFVGRIREDISHPRGLDMWVVADNVRKGAALNSVQIAELLVKSYL
ncbi:MAG: aspartate-semialdehyde dehydrogenase [Chromatiales bacterium]|jgi:aspartate-semialdehyde dehydrogenase|nr:aspartate-semialdehyde dehydrogenase [Chromatiales bacterium]